MKAGKRKVKRESSRVSALLLCLALLTGCSPFSGVTVPTTQTAEDTLPPEEDIRNLISVGFSQLGAESAWRIANTESIRGALTKEDGFYLLSDNARQKKENQIKAIRSYISQRVDYIVFAPVTEEGWETVLQEAQIAGIPVIAIDRSIELSSRHLLTSWIGEDMRQEGEKAGLWLEDYLKECGRQDDPINIVVLQGTQGSSAQLGRTIGFDSIADRHDNWNILEQRDADFTTAKGGEVMETFLKKYHDIDVVVSQNDDMTTGALEAMDRAGITTGEGGVTVLSFDSTRAGLQLLKDGRINVDIECNPLSGPLLADVIHRIENGEEIEERYYMTENVFTADNVDRYIGHRAY